MFVASKAKIAFSQIKWCTTKKWYLKMFPLRGQESKKKAWGECIVAIDEVNQRLNKQKSTYKRRLLVRM